MPKHTCHYPGCDTSCPPRHLMCGYHWSLVPGDRQREVYRTVKQRGSYIDATWAPWWRAQALAIESVGRQLNDEPALDRWLERQLETAEKLEKMT